MKTFWQIYFPKEIYLGFCIGNIYFITLKSDRNVSRNILKNMCPKEIYLGFCIGNFHNLIKHFPTGVCKVKRYHK